MHNRLAAAGIVLLGLACSGVNPSPPTVSPPEVEQPEVEPPQGEPMNTPFASQDDGLSTLLSQLPRLSAPATFPPDKADRAAALRRKIPPEQARRYICAATFFDCKLEEQRSEFFGLGQLPISAEAVGVVFVGIGDLDTPVVLVTYAPSGEIRGGQIIGGDFGDLEYGYAGTLAAADRLAVNRYVWVNGEEKEFVEDLSFRIHPDGSVDRTIVP